jgi:hypothetical protein
MKLEDLKVEYDIEATVNTGNFENVKPGYRVSATVPKDSTADEVREYLRKLADAWLEQEIEEIRNGTK